MYHILCKKNFLGEGRIFISIFLPTKWVHFKMVAHHSASQNIPTERKLDELLSMRQF